MEKANKTKKQLLQGLEATHQHLPQLEQAEEILKESEEEYERLFDILPIGITILNLKGVIIYCNSAVYNKSGYPQGSYSGKHFSKISSIRIRDLPKYISLFNAIVTGKTPKPFETSYQLKDGTTGWTELNISLLKVGGKRRILVIQHDITERRRMEESQRESEEKFSKVFRSSPEIIAITTINEGKYVEINDSYALHSGYTREELIGKKTTDINIWAKSEDRARMFEILNKQGRINNEEFGFRTKSGEIRTWLFSAEPITIGGEPCLIGVSTDITERKRMENAMKESEEKFRNLFEYAKDTVILADADTGILIDVNPAGCNLLGLPKEKIVGMHQSELHPPELAERYKQVFREHAEKGVVVTDDILVQRADGSHVECDISASVFKLRHKQIIQGVFRDVSERKRIENTLANEATRRRILIEQSRDGIVILDQDGKVYEANRRFADMLGYSLEEVHQLHVFDWEFLYPSKQVIEMIRTVDEKGDHFETQHRRKDGTIFDVEISTNGAMFAGQKLIFCVCRDITERKIAEEAIRESEKRFSDITENALEWIWEIDANGKYTYSSPVVEKILGYEPEEILNKHFYDLFHPERREELKKAAFAAFTQKQSFHEFINPNVHKNGETIWLSTSGIPIIDKEGNLTGYRGTDTDITERKKAEEALRELEEKFSIAFHSSPMMITIASRKTGKFIDVNDSFVNTTGYSREEFIGHATDATKMWVKPEELERHVRLMREQGKIRNEENTLRMKSGEIRKWLCSAEIITIGGEPCSIAVAIDITERKKMEQALRESEDKFYKAFSASPNRMIIVTLKDRKIVEVNENYTSSTGYGREEIIGHQVSELNSWVDSAQHERIMKILEKEGRVRGEEVLFRKKSGEIYTALLSIELVNIGGEPCMLIESIDITRMKQTEEELKKALANLEQFSARLAATNKELETFSYSVSHDLRSPLRSIDGFSQALLEDYRDKLDEQGQDYLNRLRSASQKMGELIDGMLKLSRLTRSEMRQEKVDLSTLAEEISTRLKETQPERRAKFVIHSGLTTKGDPQMMRVLLENLLGNAWKFTGKTPQAEIEFGSTNKSNKKTFFVKDNGAGFDMTYVHKLFGAFQRLHDTADFPGTGIGLATVQRIINRHGGSIWAEGAVGKGATFYFTL